MNTQKTKILVRGPVLTRSGYGEHVRFLLRALRTIEDKVDIYVIALGWGQTGWITENDEERKWLDEVIKKTVVKLNGNDKNFDVSVQVSIPNEWEQLAPINIGVTAGIETTKVAPIWTERGNMMDLIIVPSTHSKQVYENTKYEVTVKETNQVIPDYRCQTPVKVVSYPVKDYESVELPIELSTDFNFLAVAQWGPRKNIENCVQWFVEEFIDQETGLILKTNLSKNSLTDRANVSAMLKNLLAQPKYKNRKCKIYLLHGDMSEAEMHTLYRHPQIKAFVSTTHGEGFGLPLFEAAYEGLPVLAPDWSGHVDFLHMPVEDKKGKTKNRAMYAKVDYTLAPVQEKAVWDGVIQKDSMWCYPEQGSFKMRMREIYKDHGRFKKQASLLQAHLRKTLSKEQQYEKIIDHFKDYLVSLIISEEDAEWMNELNKITEL